MLVCVVGYALSDFISLAYSSNLWKRRDGLFERFGANMSVMCAHRLRIMTDKLHDDGFRDPSVFEQAHRGMPQRMEAQTI